MISGELLKIRRPLISNIVSSIVGIACDTLLRLYFTAQKVAVFGVILVRIFPHLKCIRRDLSEFSPKAEKYGPNPCLPLLTMFVSRLFIML